MRGHHIRAARTATLGTRSCGTGGRLLCRRTGDAVRFGYHCPSIAPTRKKAHTKATRYLRTQTDTLDVSELVLNDDRRGEIGGDLGREGDVERLALRGQQVRKAMQWGHSDLARHSDRVGCCEADALGQRRLVRHLRAPPLDAQCHDHTNAQRGWAEMREQGREVHREERRGRFIDRHEAEVELARRQCEHGRRQPRAEDAPHRQCLRRHLDTVWYAKELLRLVEVLAARLHDRRRRRELDLELKLRLALHRVRLAKSTQHTRGLGKRRRTRVATAGKDELSLGAAASAEASAGGMPARSPCWAETA